VRPGFTGYPNGQEVSALLSLCAGNTIRLLYAQNSGVNLLLLNSATMPAAALSAHWVGPPAVACP
jgi:hypothetical protein